MDNEFEKDDNIKEEPNGSVGAEEEAAAKAEPEAPETAEAAEETVENSEAEKEDDASIEAPVEEQHEIGEAEEQETVEADEAETEGTQLASQEDAAVSGETADKEGNFFTRWKAKAIAKEQAKIERELETDKRIKEMMRQRQAEMYADGKEPNALQKFLMSEGKYINYDNKQAVILVFVIILAIILSIFIYRAGYITKDKFGLGNDPSRAIVYSKDNELYCYDLKGNSVLISDNLSSGGFVTYSYVGSGTTVAGDGNSVYFIDNVAADGTFSLNFFDAKKKNDPALIADDVADYKISWAGDGAVYAVPNEGGQTGTLYGYSKKTGKSAEIAQNVSIGGSDYDITSDGKYAVYASQENGTYSLNICGTDGSDPSVIDTDVAQYLVTERGSYIYYVKTALKDDGTSGYSIYKYDFGKKSSELIDEDIIAVTLTKDENAVLYYKYNGNMVKASDVVNDDGDDSEETKALRAEIAEYEFKDIACSVYRYENGSTELIDDDVFNAVPMDDEGKYIAYSVPQKLDEITVNLSDTSSVNEISAYYYMQAMKAECDIYVHELGGFDDYVMFENSYIYSYQNAASNAQFACFKDYDESTGKGQLVLATYYKGGIKAYSELEEDVESFQFLGDGTRITYLSDVGEDGAGTLRYIESNVADVISESAYYYEGADDMKRRVFYLDDYDSSTYGGTFHYYQQGDDTVVDDNVYMFAYRDNDNALYMKDYDTATGSGDLYYLDGKKAVLVDENVSSVFDFYDAA